MLIKNNKIGNEKIDFKMGKKKWEIENADCGKAEKSLQVEQRNSGGENRKGAFLSLLCKANIGQENLYGLYVGNLFCLHLLDF